MTIALNNAGMLLQEHAVGYRPGMDEGRREHCEHGWY